LDVNIGENVGYRFLRNEIDIYEVICITDKYTKVSIGEKYLLFLVIEGNGIIYIINYNGILLAKYPINECVNFMTPAVYRDFQMSQILEEQFKE
jgi:hypothetical protein